MDVVGGLLSLVLFSFVYLDLDHRALVQHAQNICGLPDSSVKGLAGM